MEVDGAVVFRILVDLCCLGAVSVPILIFNVAVEPFQQGFFCDDESLMHPYKPDTIPTSVASSAAMIIPVSIIIITEGVRHSIFKRHCHADIYCKRYAWILYRLISAFLFGAAVTQLTTDIGKYSIGRLRPHFLTLCKPHIANCTTTTGYITEDVCTIADKGALKEARLSFPSGHTSITVYSFIFTMIYLQVNFRWRKCWLLRPFLQTILFYLTYYTSLSRISDYKHHWGDVLGGCVLGLIVCNLVAFCVSDILGNANCCKTSYDLDNKGLPLYKSTGRLGLDQDNMSNQTSSESSTSSTNYLVRPSSNS